MPFVRGLTILKSLPDSFHPERERHTRFIPLRSVQTIAGYNVGQKGSFGDTDGHGKTRKIIVGTITKLLVHVKGGPIYADIHVADTPNKSVRVNLGSI